MLKLLRGLLRPQSGEVWRAAGAHLGFVFQNPDYQICAEEVWEEVALGPRQVGLDPGEVDRRVEEALARVHLLDHAQDDPFSLTKGQRQCLAVADVLALAPKVIILDEPTTGLDYREQRDLLDLVADLHAQGCTIIMVTHSMWAAATYAQRLVVLQDGQVCWTAPPGRSWSRKRFWPGPGCGRRPWCGSAAGWGFCPDAEGVPGADQGARFEIEHPIRFFRIP